jgi:integrase
MEHFIDVIGDIHVQDVRLRHAERFRQACLDKGYRRATVAKKLRHLKRLVALAVKREQLDENPLQGIDMPKTPKKCIRILSPDECRRLLKAAGDSQDGRALRWDMLIRTALTTGMRRGELLNAVWRDIDFADMTISVSSKDNTPETWRWLIKDEDERTLPLTEELVAMLSEHQGTQPEGYPYVFLPPTRYDHVQELRRQGRWTFASSRQKLVLNFTRDFRKILKQAGIDWPVKFHDLRRTALSAWLANGMSEYDVMALAGHACFDTTHEFYLAVRKDLVGRARKASFGAQLARA